MADYGKAIIKLNQKGKSEREISELLDVPKTTVHKIIVKYNETGTTDRRRGCGRPRTARTPANKRKIKERIQRNPSSRKNSKRKMAAVLGIGRESVGNILDKDLGMKSRKEAEGQNLEDGKIQKRAERCPRLLRRFGGGRHRLIMFSDEAWYDIEQAHNTQNDRNWSEQPLPLNDRIIPRQQHPKQVMVWAGVGHGVQTPLFFVPAGVSINGEVYREFLRTEVFPWARRHYGNRHWVFMQDPAPAHKAIETQDLIRANVPEFIEVDISPQRNNGEWPATSPDLNPLDYSI
uniref:Transposase n=1 Tax=Ditylenchus dipsaci TaxID=166011 RepID=A0A915D0E1_9BILA